MIEFCTVGTVLNFYLLMTTIFPIASHQPGVHEKTGFKQFLDT